MASIEHTFAPVAAVALSPESRPDPLGDHLASLERTIALVPRLVLPGHGEPKCDPVARARELPAHHAARSRRPGRAARLEDGGSVSYTEPR